MIQMASYYAHESNVGPVFDVANYSRAKAIKMAILCLGFGSAVAVAALYVWNPDWIAPEPSTTWADAHQETKQLMRDHPIATKAGVACAVFFSLVCLAGMVSCVANAMSNDFYIRVGEGGISMRVPDGLIGKFERDFSWDEISNITVVQEKWLGSTSRNAGNIGGELKIRTHNGFAQDFRLDDFQQDAWLIHQRIDEARETQVADLAEPVEM